MGVPGGAVTVTGMEFWSPAGIEYRAAEQLVAGDTIGSDFRVWRIVRVSHDTTAGTVTLRSDMLHGEPIPGYTYGYDLMVHTCRATHRVPVYPDPERLPLCRCHAYPWPCRQLMDDQEARRDLQRMVELSERAQDGCCFACGEPIGPRQRSMTMPEPNVMLPGYPPPAFHLRSRCETFRRVYEQERRDMLGKSWTPVMSPTNN